MESEGSSSVSVEEKYCNGCKEKHPITDFSKDSTHDDGLNSTCKKDRKKKSEDMKKRKELKEFLNDDELDKIIKKHVKYPEGDIIPVEELDQWSFDQLTIKAIDLAFEIFPKDKVDLIKMIMREEPNIFEKTCGDCGGSKSITNFVSHPNGKYGLNSKCKKCKSKYNDEYRNTTEGYVRFLLKGLKYRAKTNNENEFTITFDYLMKTITEKPYMELLPDFPLYPRPGDWQISLGKHDESKDYSEQNLRILPSELNCRIKWSNEKILSILEISYSIKLSEDEIERQLYEKHPGSSQLYTGKLQINEVDETVRCKYCGVWKDLQSFSKTSPSRCRDCFSEYDKSRPNFLNGKLRSILKDCKASAKRKENSNNRRGEFNLTLDDLIDIYKSQGGRCKYSKIRFQFGSINDTWWVLSPERVDVMRGYTRDNVVLICAEFNTTDFTSILKYESEGTGRWNKSKFKVFYNAVKEHYG